mgnify:CR=1 FL=1
MSKIIKSSVAEIFSDWARSVQFKDIPQSVKNKLKIKILCFPRIFGYVFNPISIIYCYDEGKLISIFYEVKNTSNEQHTYFFRRGQNKSSITLKHECEKNFYVSPFIGMKGKYSFTNKVTNDYLNIIIDLYDSNNKKILMAAQSGKFTAFKASKLLLCNSWMRIKLLGFPTSIALLIVCTDGFGS